MAKHKKRITPKPPKRPEILLNLKMDSSKLLPIVAMAREREWKLNLIELSPGPPEELCPDGALIRGVPTSPLAQRLRDIGCPVVRLGNLPHPKDDLMPAVLPDQATAGRMAAEHFAQRQFKEVAFVGNNLSDPEADFRCLHLAFQEAAAELDMNFHSHSVAREGELELTPSEREKRRADAMLEWLRGIPKPVGLFTFADGIAMKICKACYEAELNIPEEIAILSRGNNIWCELAPVELSSIDTNSDEICRKAMLTLEQLMNGEEVPTTPIMVPPKRVVLRHSTDVLATKDPVVNRALSFLWAHIGQDLSVEDVVRVSGVSHSTLQRKFHNCLGRGIVAELKRKRLERVRELLRGSDMNIAEIAAVTDFHSKGYLHRVFRDVFDMTPRQYRLRHKPH